jgi:hypothetical protein
MKNAPHLTVGHAPVLAKQIAATRPGMAHFAATGPFGQTCGTCVHLAYWQQVRNASGNIVKTKHRKGCAKFHALTGQHGPPVRASTEACRHFERRDDACTCATCTSQDTTSDG